MNEDIDKKDWEEFRSIGLLWFVNRILHIFGWAIIVIYNDDDEAIGAYPARVPYRGFDYTVERRGFRELTNWMACYAEDLHLEVSKGRRGRGKDVQT